MSHTLTENKKVRIVEQFLENTYEDAQASSRWISKQSISLQELANKRSLSFYLVIREKNTKVPKNLLSIAARLNIFLNIHDTYKKAHRKNANFQSDDIALLDTLEVNSFIVNKRVAKKREFLQKKLPQILKWRNLDISWQSIASKLLTIEGETISAEYIRKTISSLKEVS